MNAESFSPRPRASILVPAHNEQASVGRLLSRLLEGTAPGEFEILVLANGCTDRTVEIARGFEPVVRVLDLPEPSKRAALKRGDAETNLFPRLYVDGDVEIGAADVRALCAALDAGHLVAAPLREIPRDGVSPIVRAFYDVWELLPQVRDAPFGRGVVALSERGSRRVRDLPPVMADDLAMTAAFTAADRVVVPDARVIVWPPRTARDLVRRRTRVYTGNEQFDRLQHRRSDLVTSRSDLVRLARQRPSLIPKLGVFLGISAVAKVRSRNQVRAGDWTTWLRDESSRSR